MHHEKKVAISILLKMLQLICKIYHFARFQRAINDKMHKMTLRNDVLLQTVAI